MRLLRGGLALVAAFVVLSMAGIPTAYAAVDCNKGKPDGWEIIPEASSGGGLTFLCNYRVTKKLPNGSTTLSGTAVTVEFYCNQDAGAEAFRNKTNPRETETKRDSNRVVMEEGPAAHNGPDNPHRDGVFSSFFPDKTFDLFEKEWLLFANRQAVATIVVITNKAEGRHSAKDVEPVARQLAFHNAPTECKISLIDEGGTGTTGGSTGGTGTTTGTNPGSKTGTVGTGGGVNPAVVATAVAAGGGAVAVVTRRRRRVKFKPPRPTGTGPNLWDPSEDDQRKRWERERKVWDPDTLSWRDPRDDDFENVPEDPAWVEQTIPVDKVPTNCLDIYWRYANEQGQAKDLQRLVETTNTKLTESEERLRTNLIRAKAQLGFDIGGAVAGITMASIDAARAAFKPRPGGARGGPNMSDLADEIRSRVKKRTAELNGEMEAIKGRLAKAQAELDAFGMDAARVKNALDDAASDAANARRKLAELQDNPAELKAKREALLAEERELRKKFAALSNEKEYIDKLGDFRMREGKDWEGTSTYQDHVKTQLRHDAELEKIMKDAGHVPGGPDVKLSPEASARFEELLRLKREAASLEDAAFEKWLRGQPGFDHNWPTLSDASTRKQAIRQEQADVGKRMREAASEADSLENKLRDMRESGGVSPERKRLEGQVTDAELREKNALANKEKLEKLQADLAKEKSAAEAAEKSKAKIEKETDGLIDGMSKLSEGKRPGLAPAVLLGAALAWLSPAAAVMAVVGIIAWAGADLAGIGPQSPETIWNILTSNKLEVEQLKTTLSENQPKLDTLLKGLPDTRKNLDECMNPPPKTTAGPKP